MNQRAAIKNDILISIQPEYADQIMDGCKTVELRRRFVETVDRNARLFIYSSMLPHFRCSAAAEGKISLAVPAGLIGRPAIPSEKYTSADRRIRI